MTNNGDVRPSPKPLGQPIASESQRTLRTTHVKLIAAQLEAALKKRARETRVVDRQKSRAQAAVSQSVGMPSAPVGTGVGKIPRLVVEVPTPPNQTPKPDSLDINDSGEGDVGAEERPDEPALGLTTPTTSRPIPKALSRPELNFLLPTTSKSGHEAWWLDVACPRWEDMRLLGKVGGCV
jgi:hypothetical protein